MRGFSTVVHRCSQRRKVSPEFVSVSLGLQAVFLWGGKRRADRTRRIRLESGDVVVWGGPARFIYHGVAPLPGWRSPADWAV